MADTVINGTDLLLYRKLTNAINANALNAGGTGYAVNDIFTVAGGTSLAIGKVLTVNSGAVLTYQLTYLGEGYSITTGATTTNVIGSGSGLKINITSISATYNKATGHSTSHSLSISQSLRETSSKASGIYTSRESGKLDVSGSAEGLAVYDDEVGFKELQRLVTTRTPVFMTFAQDNSGAPDTSKFYATGYFYLTSVEITAPNQDNVTYSVSFELANSFTQIN